MINAPISWGAGLSLQPRDATRHVTLSVGSDVSTDSESSRQGSPQHRSLSALTREELNVAMVLGNNKLGFSPSSSPKARPAPLYPVATQSLAAAADSAGLTHRSRLLATTPEDGHNVSPPGLSSLTLPQSAHILDEAKIGQEHVALAPQHLLQNQSRQQQQQQQQQQHHQLQLPQHQHHYQHQNQQQQLLLEHVQKEAQQHLQQQQQHHEQQQANRDNGQLLSQMAQLPGFAMADLFVEPAHVAAPPPPPALTNFLEHAQLPGDKTVPTSPSATTAGSASGAGAAGAAAASPQASPGTKKRKTGLVKRQSSGKSRAYASWCDQERDEVCRALLGIVLHDGAVSWRGRRQDLVAIGAAVRTKSKSQCRDFYYRCLKQISKLLAKDDINVDLASDCELARASLILYLQHHRLANDGAETRHLNFSARDQAARYLGTHLTRSVRKYLQLPPPSRREMLITSCVRHLRREPPQPEAF